MHTCRRSSAAAAVVLMLFGTVIFGASALRASDDLSLGVTALNSGSAEIAVKHFSAVIQSGKRSMHELSAALHYRAKAYVVLKRPALAIADIDSALWLRKMSPVERESALRLKNKALQSVGLASSAQAKGVSKPSVKAAVTATPEKAAEPVVKAEKPKTSPTHRSSAAIKQAGRLSNEPSVTQSTKAPEWAVAKPTVDPTPNWVTSSVKTAVSRPPARTSPRSANAVVKKSARTTNDAIRKPAAAKRPAPSPAAIAAKSHSTPMGWPKAVVAKPVKSEPLEDVAPRKRPTNAVARRVETNPPATAAVAARPAHQKAIAEVTAKPTRAVAAVAEPWTIQLDRKTGVKPVNPQPDTEERRQSAVGQEVQTGSIVTKPEQVVEDVRADDKGDEPVAAAPGSSLVEGFMSFSGMTTKAPPQTADRLRAAEELARRRREMIRRHNELQGASTAGN